MDFTEMSNKMYAVMNDLANKLANVRIGVVHERMFNNIYIKGTDFSTKSVLLNEIAVFKKLDVNTISITPWDHKLVKKIAKAISDSPLDVTPSNDGVTVMVRFSPVTQESRNKASKLVKDIGESAKIAIRQIRKNENQKFKKMLNNPLAPEFVNGLHEAQKITDKFIKSIDADVDAKQKELKL